MSAVVLIHGTRAAGSQWDPQRPALEAAGYTVITPDLPGHGHRTGEPFTLRAATAAVVEAVRSAGEVPVQLVGHSLGGMLAIHAAGSRGIRMPHLASLIACGAAIQPTPRRAHLYGRVMAAMPRLPGATRPSARARRADADIRGGWAGTEVIGPAMRAVAAIDLRADLARITVPVTILSPRFDQFRREERAFAAAAPHGHLEVLPYGTHLVNRTRPRRFTHDLLRLLRTAPGSR